MPFAQIVMKIYNFFLCYVFFAVTLGGGKCGQEIPGVYTDVAHYKDFIDSV